MQNGFGLSCNKQLREKVDFVTTVNGVWIDYPDKSYTYIKKNRFLLDITTGLQVKLLKEKSTVNPFVFSGISLNNLNSKTGFLIPVGLGFQINLFDDAFIISNFQHQFSISENTVNHFFYSIGIATNVNIRLKKQKKEKEPREIPEDISTDENIPVIKIADRDDDGTIDELDFCPDKAGDPENNGCPYGDRDKDGVLDNMDICPDEKGFADNNGCPVIEPIVAAQLQLAAQHIYFENNQSELLATSFESLQLIEQFLNTNPTAELLIEGHTDNVGDSLSNIVLSVKRAEAVVQYLITKGIAKERLQFEGYGETRPKFTNNNIEGRAKNRRVEIIVIHN